MASPRGPIDRWELEAPRSEDSELVEELKAFVRREMGRSGESPARVKEPSMREGAWLLLFCVNAVLLVSRLPNEIVSDPAVQTASKLLPALLGSHFVIYVSWFREHLLTLTRHRLFNRLQLGLFVILAITALPVVPVSPQVLPKGTALSIDGKTRADKKLAFLYPGAHEVLLQPAKNAGAEPRKFRLTGGQLLRTLWKGNPEWSLLYKADFEARDTAAKVQIRKLRGEFYDDVVQATDLDRLDDSTLVLSMNGTDTRTIRLPLGRYETQWILGSGQACQVRPLDIDGGDTSVTRLEGVPCAGR